MSLGQLLEATKSLSGVRTGLSRYKMRQEYFLPKFGVEKRPEAKPLVVAAPLNPEPQDRTTQEPVAPEPAAERYEGTHMSDAPLPSPFSARLTHGDGEVPNPEQVVTNEPKAKIRRPGLFRRWMKVKNPFGSTTSARRAPAPVQCELRLDAV